MILLHTQSIQECVHTNLLTSWATLTISFVSTCSLIGILLSTTWPWTTASKSSKRPLFVPETKHTKDLIIHILKHKLKVRMSHFLSTHGQIILHYHDFFMKIIRLANFEVLLSHYFYYPPFYILVMWGTQLHLLCWQFFFK